MLLVRKMMGNKIWQLCEKEHATTGGGDGVSRARDDRLTFQDRLGADTIEFSVDGAWRCWLAGLLACAAMHGEATSSRRVLWPAPVIGHE
jgi:hypothetical protein